jgi:cytochrome P450
MTATQYFKTEHGFTTDVDVSSAEFWSKSFVERDETFAWLRENAPVSWHPPFVDPAVPPSVHGEAGFWAVTRSADIKFESVNHEMFSSTAGGASFRPTHPALVFPPTFVEMDPPEHNTYRQAMSAAFTPKGVKRIAHQIEDRAAAIVDRVVGAGDFDFVEEVSAKLPMLTIADMVGVPESLETTFAKAGDGLVVGPAAESIADGVSPIEYFIQQRAILQEIGVDLVRHRRQHPAEDVATSLANYKIDGEYLTDEQIGSMMMLLSVAGNDTTKQTTTHTLVSLSRNPDQRAWLVEDYEARISPAIDEFIRHASPVIAFARRATQDIELSGQQIVEGDKVVMFYCSGNRDESVFADPHAFDLTRQAAGHVAFGGGGVHFCLGNMVAKVQLRALYREITTKLSNIEVGEPTLLRSEFINGITHLPVRVRGR